ncbi:hypothetical protein F0562_009681 [Nyssa sinensis]|uniref:Uncharacterized protein n=1 Tax=Nyssa sinensis TaxID=561372 RepID=A0A5J4ZZY2_9ASTE|nr:hypothetical protein F0562_009681 [Nyssa sinensis]
MEQTEPAISSGNVLPASESGSHIPVQVLAEFITDMGRNCETVDEFDAKLKENGAEMPDYFVRTLLTIIHAILPPKEKSKKDVPEGKKSNFQALAISDSRERVKELERDD